MTTSPEEQKDLDANHKKVAEIKDHAYDYMRTLLEYDAEALRTCGHKSLGAALEWSMRDTDRKINKIWADHIRKYPD